MVATRVYSYLPPTSSCGDSKVRSLPDFSVTLPSMVKAASSRGRRTLSSAGFFSCFSCAHSGARRRMVNELARKRRFDSMGNLRGGDGRDYDRKAGEIQEVVDFVGEAA